MKGSIVIFVGFFCVLGSISTVAEESTDRSRVRRDIFGRDTRKRIPLHLLEKYPFSAIVRVGEHCTGTLIWYKHVITAAHCVHHGKKWYNFMPKSILKAGLLQDDGSTRWIGVENIMIPPAWIRNQGTSGLPYDYAILELKQPHGRRWMPFGVGNLRPNDYIQFAGFPGDKRANELWYTYCTVRKTNYHTISNYCDATFGMSGSGVYTFNKAENKPRKLIGVFSANLKTSRFFGWIKESQNIAVRLTPQKVYSICNAMGAGKRCEKLTRYRRYY